MTTDALDERFCRAFDDGIRRGGLWISPGEARRISPLVSSGSWPTDIGVANVLAFMLLIDHKSLWAIVRAKKEEIKELRRDIGNVDKQARLRVEAENANLLRGEQQLQRRIRELESQCAMLASGHPEKSNVPMSDQERAAWSDKVDGLTDRVRQLELHVDLLKNTNRQLSEKLKNNGATNG